MFILECLLVGLLVGAAATVLLHENAMSYWKEIVASIGGAVVLGLAARMFGASPGSVLGPLVVAFFGALLAIPVFHSLRQPMGVQ